VEIFGSWTLVISLFKKKWKSHSTSLKKKENISRCSQWFISQTCKISISNTLYIWLRKNYKYVDLSKYTFKSPNLIGFSHFCVAHNIKNFAQKICMLVGYVIKYDFVSKQQDQWCVRAKTTFRRKTHYLSCTVKSPGVEDIERPESLQRRFTQDSVIRGSLVQS
jgi:hypothetical protein